jgi:hypothetical protein
MSKLVISTALIGAMLCAAPAYASSHQKTKSDAALIRYLEKPVRYSFWDNFLTPGFGARICEPNSHYYTTKVCN